MKSTELVMKKREVKHHNVEEYLATVLDDLKHKRVIKRTTTKDIDSYLKALSEDIRLKRIKKFE